MLIIHYEFSVIYNIIFSILLGIFYVGVLELVHQCTHNNAFDRKVENIYWGVFFSSLIHFNFKKYKNFHMDHHIYVCTTKDPENELYTNEINPIIQILLAPIFFYKFCYVVMKYKRNNISENEKHHSNIFIYIYIIIMMLSLYFNYKYFLYLYCIPFLIFTYIDFLFNQAEHYGYDQVPITDKDRIIYANNIELPFIFSWVFLFRNYHQLHHRYPKIKWYNSYEFYIHNFSKLPCCSTKSYFEFLKEFIMNGVRIVKAK